MNGIELLEESKIENMIYEVRGKQVMLDSDLALLYQVETKRINEAVRNNLKKFPERFSWLLSNNEWDFLRSKFSTSSLVNNNHGGRRHSPRVFTEQGVAMLATILKSTVATQVSIAIMDAFIMMRKYISNELIEQKYINNLVIKHDEDIKLLQESFNKFKGKKIMKFILKNIKLEVPICDQKPLYKSILSFEDEYYKCYNNIVKKHQEINQKKEGEII